VRRDLVKSTKPAGTTQRIEEADMSINEKSPDLRELKPRITVFGVGGAGGNAVNNMIRAGLQGVDFVVANTDVQALAMAETERIIQMGVQVTAGLGAGSRPDVGRAAMRAPAGLVDLTRSASRGDRLTPLLARTVPRTNCSRRSTGSNPTRHLQRKLLIIRDY